jgi:gamma-D-glutamyl-L-lysine dipeptidyl-peptidase
VQHGICLLSVVPCRRDPSGTSEMVTQLLFGESYSVLSAADDWLRIRIAHDGYECWLSEKQHTPLTAKSFNALSATRMVYVQDLVQVMHDRNHKTSFPITIGTALPFFEDRQMRFDDHLFSFEGSVTAIKKNNAGEILSTAFVFMNAPYLWGGRGPFGIDCSGFTQIVFRLNGYPLPRDARQQVSLGEPLNFVEESRPGDLAFFDNPEGTITHVGILLGNGQIIHASGRVRIDKLDHYGIINSDSGRYSHNLRIIKRIL